jgi:hypothetical protein
MKLAKTYLAVGSAICILSLPLALWSCGGSGAALPGFDQTGLDSFLPTGALKVTGINRSGFNPPNLTVGLELTGSKFTSMSVYELSVNGTAVPLAAPVAETNAISVPLNLISGENVVRIVGADSNGRPVYWNENIYVGGNPLTVNLVDNNGAPLLEETSVTVSLSDDPTIRQTLTSSNGSVTFDNIPARTVVVEGKTGSNLSGVTGGIGSTGTLSLKLVGLNAASTTNNNDFSQGLAGWDIGSAPVQLIDHVETVGGTASRSRPPRQPRDLKTSKLFQPPFTRGREGENQDLQLSTSGEGPQTVSRTFRPEVGVTKVSVRYRFVTSEIPGGFFGTEFNDYFSVSIRSSIAGKNITESNTMNGLGEAAFDASGSTQWRTAELEVDQLGDTVQVDLTVANVEDDAYDSQIIVDFIEEDKVQIRPVISWDNEKGGLKLTYTVEGGPVETATDIKVFWAKGTTYGSRIGNSFFTVTVPKDTPVGTSAPIAISADKLVNEPKLTAFVLASVSATNVASTPDVELNYDANADKSAVSEALQDILKDAGRAAGQAEVYVSSTARSPKDQARAMFQNLTNPANSIETNITNQLALYASQGDSVINVFRSASNGKTLAQVQSSADSIITSMEGKVIEVGPSNVSTHCVDTTTVSVVDIGLANMSANAPLFLASASPRVTKFIDEIRTNNCYHFELTK